MIIRRIPASIVAGIALIAVSAASATAQVSFASDSAMAAIAAQRVQSGRAMGIVVAAMEKGRPPRVQTAGVSGIVGVPLDANTVFEIGSVTKAFTGALLAEMVSRGEVALDDPVARYLPSSVRLPSRNGKQITLLDLATQSSGLPRLPGNMRPADIGNPYADYSVSAMYEFLSGYTLTRDPGAKYEYSNLGVGLLGHALALKAGMSYEKLLRERILEPLGMHDTWIDLPQSLKSRMAQGFDAVGTPVASWDLPTLAGAGALKSSAGDMLKFLAANLDSTSSPLGRQLAFARSAKRDADRPGNSIGLGWHIVTVFGTTATWHNGGTGGFRSFIGLDEARHRGVIVLTNSTSTPDDIGFHILEPRVGLDLSVAPGHNRKEVVLEEKALEPMVGVYAFTPEFSMTITREGASLFAQATGQQRFQIFAESPTEFYLKVVNAQLTFVRDASDNVVQLVLHQNGQNVPAKKVK